MTTNGKWRILILIGILAGAGAGWINGEHRAMQYEVALEQAHERETVLKQELNVPDEAEFYRGMYVMCRALTANVLQWGDEQAIVVCNESVKEGATLKVYSDSMWTDGYAP